MLSSVRFFSVLRATSCCCFSTVTAAMVKQLRELTGAPMMDCKKALQAEGVNGDMEKAIDVLRKQGMKRVNKVSSRTTQQGVIASRVDESKASLVELACETDFVARNEVFQKLAGEITDIVFKTGLTNPEDIQKQSLASGTTVGDHMKEVIAKLGENIVLSRASSIEVSPSDHLLCSYLHNSVGPNMSQIAALVSFAVTGDKTKIDQEALRKIGMHIAAAHPLYLNREAVPAEKLDAERALIMETVKKMNKPEKILNRMVEGKLGDFYKQSVLLDQLFILDEKQGSVSNYLKKIAKQAGCTIEIDQFIRMQVGGK